MTDNLDDVIAKIQKLLNLAAKNPNAEEAASAAAKAQELLIKHNLDAATVERDGGDDAKRERAKVEGGFYQYQRDLWRAVGKLNFCLYWSQIHYVHVENMTRKDSYGGTYKTSGQVRRRRHALIGRKVNVKATEVMAQYLEREVERFSKERFPDRRIDNYTMSYREGLVYKLSQRLNDKRRTLIDAEVKKAREAMDRAARAGVSTSTALTLASYADAEERANYDERYGAGSWDERLASEQAAAEASRSAEQAYVKWAAANPEAARKKEEAEKKKEERENRSASRQRWGKTDDGAFWAGVDAADEISLEPQVGSESPGAKRIGRTK